MLIETQEAVEQLIHSLNSSRRRIIVDTETNYTDRYHERYCMGISIECNGELFYLPVRHSSWMTPNAPNVEVPSYLLSGVQAELVFHNAKFDLHVLRKLGVIIRPDTRVYDTMLMAHLLNENLDAKKGGYSLENLSRKLLPGGKEIELKDIWKGTWEEMPSFAMAKYAETDVLRTGQLYDLLKPAFADFEKVWEVDEKFMYLLQKMEEKGLILDKVEARELQVMCEDRIEAIKKELGFDPSKPSQLHKRLFAEPPVGLGLPITQETPTGKPQVNIKYLESLQHPIAGLLLEHSELKKQLTSYYRPYLDFTEGHDRIHASFKQHGTVTGRLSCADPNMHQIPRESPIKKLFLPERGKQLWELDFSALEPRLAAVYSQEPVLLELFATGGDYHQLTASSLKIPRQDGKGVNLTMLYGGGAPSLMKKLKCDQKTAYKHVNGFWNTYRAMDDFKNRVNEAAEADGEIKLWSGRKRRFPYKSEARKAFNSLIQGGGFEIVKRATMYLDDAGYDIRNQVHDSVWLMLDSEKDVPEAEHIMSDWTKKAFGLHFAVESKRLS
ncbi:DNA polymerase [Caudoviricetes sp.]|nr:DNA polymerase [Caudoviricetes sp.]